MADARELRPAACPDPEVLAAFVEHGLPPAERAQVEAHLAGCGDCLALLGEIGRAVEELHQQVPTVPEVPRVPTVSTVRASQRWLAAGGAGLALAASLLLVARVAPERLPAWLGGSDVDPRFAALVEAVGEQRYIEPRLTGGFRYGPLRSPTRSGSGAPTDNLLLLAAAGELQKAAEADPSAENLHAWGVALVLLGRYDEGVAALERASGLAPASAAVASDLAAAYLARGTESGSAGDLIRAETSAGRAVRLPEAPIEAWFNRALALQRLGRPDEASVAWAEYDARADDPRWSSGIASPSTRR